MAAYRCDQADDATAPPMDELDSARKFAEVEAHASQIEQIENRIKQIDTAFSRLEQGGYGVCEECGSEILLARLEALPLATRCIGCQKAHSRGRRGEGGMIEPFGRQWDVPTEIDESTETPATKRPGNPRKSLLCIAKRRWVRRKVNSPSRRGPRRRGVAAGAEAWLAPSLARSSAMPKRAAPVHRAGDEGAGDECLDERLTVRH